MVHVKYIESNGAEHDLTVESGLSAMEAAVRNHIPGIDGDCGGQAACATCHVYVDPAWLAKTGEADPGVERQMLEFSDIAQPNSRLACQIKLTDDLNGLILRMPMGQF